MLVITEHEVLNRYRLFLLYINTFVSEGHFLLFLVTDLLNQCIILNPWLHIINEVTTNLYNMTY